MENKLTFLQIRKKSKKQPTEYGQVKTVLYPIIDSFKFNVGDAFILNDYLIKSEANFCWWLRKFYGTGEFSIMSSKKTHKDFVGYWKGEIFHDKFQRDPACSDFIDQQTPNFMEELDREDFDDEDDFHSEVNRKENEWTEDKKRKYRNTLRGPFNLSERSLPVGDKHDFESPKRYHKSFTGYDTPVGVDDTEEGKDLRVW